MMEYNDQTTILLAEPETKTPGLHRRRPKHLKKRGGGKLFRLGVFSLTVMLVGVLLSAGGTFSKYTASLPKLDIPLLKAENFAFEAKEMSAEEAEAYKETLALTDKQLLACAFTVSNQDASGKVSGVDMMCNLTFRAKLVVDLNGPIGDLAFRNVLPTLREKIKVKLFVEGTEVATLLTENSSAASQSLSEQPMYDAEYRSWMQTIKWFIFYT